MGDGAVRSFRTMSDDACDPVRFVVLGDNRTSSGTGVSVHYAGILDEAFAELPDFFVNTGDMVKNGEGEDQWEDLLRTSEPTWSQTATLPTVGNHDESALDGDAANYNLVFDLPRNAATGTEDYYALDVGPMHIVSLSSQHTGTTEMAAMAAWLDADLAATEQPWKIVFFHKGMYSRGGHVTGASGAPLNRNLIAVIDAHHVDVVLNGHSHDYERFAPSRGADLAFGGTGRVFPIGGAAALVPGVALPDGAVATTYVLSGGGGANLTTPALSVADCEAAGCTACGTDEVACDDEVLANDFRGAVSFSKRHNFVAIEVAGGRLHLQAVATATGNDSPALLDELTIDKPSFVCVPRAPSSGAPRVDIGSPLDGIDVISDRPRGAGDEGVHAKTPRPVREGAGPVTRVTVPTAPTSCASTGGALWFTLALVVRRRARSL